LVTPTPETAKTRIRRGTGKIPFGKALASAEYVTSMMFPKQTAESCPPARRISRCTQYDAYHGPVPLKTPPSQPNNRRYIPTTEN
jgi:hypothetical protein